ncbi:MAG: hypothetical protein BGO55_28395 [Sphingobacteriales bacterium 50-39]|nr:hypothetical protein [Sphingobacteriales bacterium]OJW60486.1 MAG: hypothetical protein BGO55_28395 [Sphingobacteriales bacterium 50-39]
MQQKELLTQLNVAAIGEAIDHELATNLVKSYQEKYPESFTGVTIGRNIIEQILAQPGCVGMRFYDAINEKGQNTLVYVGVDASGNDMLKQVVVEKGGAISTAPAIVADRGWDTLWTWLTTSK